jgi:hypothetical protein
VDAAEALWADQDAAAAAEEPDDAGVDEPDEDEEDDEPDEDDEEDEDALSGLLEPESLFAPGSDLAALSAPFDDDPFDDEPFAAARLSLR